MARRSAPRSSRCVANEWRSTCGLSVRGRLARRPCRFRIFQKPTRLSGPPRAFTNRRGDRRPFSSARRAVALILANPAARLVAERHQPLLAALPDAGQVLLVEMQIGSRAPTSSETRSPWRTAARSARDRAGRAASRRRAARSARPLPRARETSAAPARRAAGADRRPGCGRAADRDAGSGRSRAPRRPPARPIAATSPRAIGSRTNCLEVPAIERVERCGRRRPRRPASAARSRA